MLNIANNLFSLSGKLSQLHDNKQIIKIFIEELNTIFKDHSFKWSENTEQDEKEGEIIVRTVQKVYGTVIYSNKPVFNTGTYSLLQNAIQLLAILLERIEQEAILIVQKKNLEDQVNERTKQLSKEIEDKKIIRNELKRSNNRYKNIIDTTSDMLWEIDAQGIFTFVSPRSFDILGYKPVELIGKSAFDLMSKDEAERVNTVYTDFVNNKSAFKGMINVNLHKYGHEVIMESNGIPILDDKGELLGYRGIDRDITQRINKEEILHLTRYSINKITDSIFWVDKNANLIFANNAATYKLEYTKEELLQMKVFDIDPYFTKELWKDHWKDIMEHGSITIESKHKTKSGKTFPIEITANLVKYGKKTYNCAVVRDISERKQNEAALNQRIIALTQPLDSSKEILFEDLFNIDDIQKLQDDFAEATGVATIITKLDGTPITKPGNFTELCNDIIRKTTIGCHNCYKSDAIIGRLSHNGPTIQLCKSGGLWDAGAGISVGGKHIANWLIGQVRDETQTEDEIRAYAREIGANEEETVLAYNKVPVMSKKQFDRIAKMLFTLASQLSTLAYQNIQQARFISERKKNEADLKKNQLQLKKQNNKLEERNKHISDINKELVIAKEKAVESDRLKTSFLQNLSHEIRTPMNGIMGFSSLLVENYNKKDKLEKFSKIITQRSNDLLEIINDILDIAKIESGQMTVNNDLCNLQELFTDLAVFFKEYQIRNNKENIKFQLRAFKDPLLNNIYIDKGKLKQIFINLISNAFKFTNQGEIEGGCKIKNNQLYFYVSDTGIGISPNNHKLIFERFSQAHDNTKLNTGGTGLGLPIVQGLVKILGGNLKLKSTPDQGSLFSFNLPYKVSSETNKIPAEISNINKFDFSEYTFLIVEDDSFNTEYIEELLRDTGANMIFTMYGKDAISIANEEKTDIILMDIRLPDISGYTAIKSILNKKPKSKIIAQTAYASNEEKEKALKAGCVDYISKPIKKDHLLKIISNQLIG